MIWFLLIYCLPLFAINLTLLYIGNSGDQTAMKNIQRYSFIPILNTIVFLLMTVFTIFIMINRK